MVSRTESILRRERMEATLDTLIELFAATKQTEGKSPRTVTWYRLMLRKFASFAGNGEPARISALSVNDARAFVAHLQGVDAKYKNHPLTPQIAGGLSPYTIHGYVRTMKVFGSWLQEEGFTAANIFSKLKRPKLPQPLIEVLSEEEMKKILDCINPNCLLGARLYVIVLLLLDTGIRASELVTLTVENTDISNGTIKVVGKGRKERITPFGSTTKKALLRYLTTWRPEPATEQIHHLVLATDGTSLTYQGLRKIIDRLGKRADVERLHAHLFRHTFAVRYLMAGGDLMALKLMLGHSSIEVTQQYLHLAQTHIEIQHHKFSPVDRLRIK
jgi:site-specific recombinase XerD